MYYDYNGVTARLHTQVYGLSAGAFGYYGSHRVLKVLTNTLWGRAGIYTWYTYSCYAGYSGFKLSQPHWSPVLTHNPEPRPWKRPLSQPLPPELAPLQRYAYDILGADPSKPEDYTPAIVLEENTPLAVDPNTNQPVVLQTVVISASTLATLIAKFKTGELDPVKAGYKKYLDKLEAEGIRVI
jgi:hypothetical protein